MNTNRESWVEVGRDFYKTCKDHYLQDLEGVVVLILVLPHELLEDKTFKHSRV
jgi:hypothetical protein